MGKIAIYTCIIGAYDELRQPCLDGLVSKDGRVYSLAADSEDTVEFICFVGRTEKTADSIGAWQIRELQTCLEPYFDNSRHSAALLSRFPKLMPHLLLPDFDASLWIDGNIVILDSSIYSIVLQKFSSRVLYSGVPHPSRDCVYAEARKCRDMGYLSNIKLLQLWIWLALNGTRLHSGLSENNLIFRRHNDENIVAMDTLWWRKVLRLCRRDQISLGYCLRCYSIPFDFLLPELKNARNFSGLRYSGHKTMLNRANQ